MIQLHLVADGPRDAVTLPPLISRILAVNVQIESFPWATLRQKSGVSGYRRQLLFAIRRAQDAKVAGILATVDLDMDKKRTKLKELQRAREEDRSANPPFPVALGEAEPHGEAWLLDDPVAVRRGLGLDESIKIPTVRQTKSPKETITELCRQSERPEEMLKILAEIARHVDPKRFGHPKQTGFHGLEEEVRHELGPIASHCGADCRCGDACGTTTEARREA